MIKIPNKFWWFWVRVIYEYNEYNTDNFGFLQCFEPCLWNSIMEFVAVEDDLHFLYWTRSSSVVSDSHHWQTNPDIKIATLTYLLTLDSLQK